MNLFLLWLVVLIVCMVAEIATVGLTTIWFAGGAVVAMIAYGLHAPVAVQIVLFFAVSVVLLLFTRPLAVKYINKNRYKSNYEGTIGKRVRVLEEVNNLLETGKVLLDGMEWTARMEDASVVLKKEEEAIVTQVQGVKLILVPVGKSGN
jgi:membrane protein implicated in regulation of membrane protease activity